MTAESELRTRVASIAREWIGTPFYPHVAIKGVGADCVNLGLAIFKEAGHIPIHIELPQYKLAGGEHLNSSLVHDWLAASQWFTPEESDRIKPGSVITLQIGKVVHHVGIVVEGTKFIQSIRGYGVGEYDLRDSTWSSRLRTSWKPKV